MCLLCCSGCAVTPLFSNLRKSSKQCHTDSFTLLRGPQSASSTPRTDELTHTHTASNTHTLPLKKQTVDYISLIDANLKNPIDLGGIICVFRSNWNKFVCVHALMFAYVYTVCVHHGAEAV